MARADERLASEQMATISDGELVFLVNGTLWMLTVPDTDPEWARRYPAEQIWRARKR